MDKKEYKLGEAIHQFYVMEPLRHDLANVVADRIFEKQKQGADVVDKAIYLIAVVLLVIGVVYGFSLTGNFAGIAVILIVFMVLILAMAARKEYLISYGKFQNLQSMS